MSKRPIPSAEGAWTPNDAWVAARARAEQRMAAARPNVAAPLPEVHNVRLRAPPALPRRPDRVFSNGGVFTLPLRRGPGRPRKYKEPEDQ